MKALTLTQPWASLMELGQKEVETRSWYTGYRGELVIHAAKGFPKWAKETADEKDRLMKQRGLMDEYAAVLDDRIAHFV